MPGSSVYGIFPGKNTRVGCHFFLQGNFLTQELKPGLLHLLHWQADSLPLSHEGSPKPRLAGVYEIWAMTHALITTLPPSPTLLAGSLHQTHYSGQMQPRGWMFFFTAVSSLGLWFHPGREGCWNFSSLPAPCPCRHGQEDLVSFPPTSSYSNLHNAGWEYQSPDCPQPGSHIG